MRGRWRISPDYERWLAVAAELGATAPRVDLSERAGGWRSTGPLARIALFVLGLVAAALLLGISGFRSEITLLIAGLVAALAAEWLVRARRLFASGIEEGLCVAGYLLIAGWITTLISTPAGFSTGPIATLVLIAAAGAAGLRLLNPLVTTCAVIAFVYWVGSTAAADALEQAIGGGMTSFIVGCSLALLSLVLGAREYRRPAHDRMLDWLVVTLPVAAYAQSTSWRVYAELDYAGASASRLVIVAMLLALGTAMLIIGLRRRRHAPLLGFMGCVACLAIELRGVTALATEAWLIICGLVALVVGVALDRYLRAPRNGLTSAALSSREGPLDLLQTVGAAVLAQRTASELPQSDAPVTGGGGRFGGGGASGSY